MRKYHWNSILMHFCSGNFELIKEFVTKCQKGFVSLVSCKLESFDNYCFTKTLGLKTDSCSLECNLLARFSGTARNIAWAGQRTLCRPPSDCPFARPHAGESSIPPQFPFLSVLAAKQERSMTQADHNWQNTQLVFVIERNCFKLPSFTCRACRLNNFTDGMHR